LGEKGRTLVILSLSKGVFLGRIGRGDFLGDGDYLKGLFLGWHGREKFGCFSR